MLKINGTTMPSPASMTVSGADIGDSSRRNAAGEKIIDRIAVKRSLSLRWSVLTGAQMAQLLSAVEAQPFFLVTYPDPVTNGDKQAVCCCASRSAELLRYGSALIWKEVEMVWEEQ